VRSPTHTRFKVCCISSSTEADLLDFGVESVDGSVRRMRVVDVGE